MSYPSDHNPNLYWMANMIDSDDDSEKEYGPEESHAMMREWWNNLDLAEREYQMEMGFTPPYYFYEYSDEEEQGDEEEQSDEQVITP